MTDLIDEFLLTESLKEQVKEKDPVYFQVKQALEHERALLDKSFADAEQGSFDLGVQIEHLEKDI